MDAATLDAWKNSPFGRCLQKAEEKETKQREQVSTWWQDAYFWRDEVQRDLTTAGALESIIEQCPNADVWLAVDAYRDIRQSWRGVDWTHLREKPHQIPEALEKHERWVRRTRRRHAVSPMQMRLPGF